VRELPALYKLPMFGVVSVLAASLPDICELIGMPRKPQQLGSTDHPAPPHGRKRGPTAGGWQGRAFHHAGTAGGVFGVPSIPINGTDLFGAVNIPGVCGT
jgi:hypothetical protein